MAWGLMDWDPMDWDPMDWDPMEWAPWIGTRWNLGPGQALTRGPTDWGPTDWGPTDLGLRIWDLMDHLLVLKKRYKRPYNVNVF